MPVPVMIAIGHTHDRFILDELARYGAKTPTDAAYKLIEVLDARDEHLDIMYDAIVTLASEKIMTIREHIDTWHQEISHKLTHFLEFARINIDARYATIMAVSPQKMVQSGYAVLLQNGEYMSKKDVAALNAGDKLTIKVYDQAFDIEIIHKK